MRHASVFCALAAALSALTFTVSAVASETARPAEDKAGDPGIAKLVIEKAKALAQARHEPPQRLPKRELASNYDDYRKIRFRSERAIWRGSGIDYELHLLPTGWLFAEPIELFLVDNGRISSYEPSVADFDDQRKLPEGKGEAFRMGLSGFKINGPLNSPGKSDEIVVFQGASYFRALGKGHRYGLSARGLALSTASPKGEEFPAFRAFWVEKPVPGKAEIVVHALLDSKSVSGAYTFRVRPGAATVMDVKARLFPRQDISEAGFAPLTSMFLLGATEPTRASDFRPNVHDSDGLAILNGKGERIWRPLVNHRTLQISAFLDSGPKGFGLMQRTRDFKEYQDLEARFERRPSAWIEPLSGFDDGSVVLVEIPTNEEIHDNIVAFWRPGKPMPARKALELSYRIHWRDWAPTRKDGPHVAATRVGRAGATDASRRNEYLFVIDYADTKPFSGETLPEVRLSVSQGQLKPATVQKNPETGGLRVSFYFDPVGASTADMRMQLGDWGARKPETWLYRWSPHK